MPMRVKFALLTVLLASCSFAGAEKVADIRPQGYVTDLAQVIDPATKAKLETLCEIGDVALRTKIRDLLCPCEGTGN